MSRKGLTAAKGVLPDRKADKKDITLDFQKNSQFFRKKGAPFPLIMSTIKTDFVQNFHVRSAAVFQAADRGLFFHF